MRNAFVTIAVLFTAQIAAVPHGAIAAPSAVKRTVQVMDFGATAEPVEIAFSPTTLAAGSRGAAEVRLDRGVMKLHATFSNLRPASQLGRGDLAYVLWSVTPQGRATNHGEITLQGSQGEMDAKVEWRRFGLLVTAEPYFAVSRPSTAVVFAARLAPAFAHQIPVTETACSLFSRPAEFRSAAASKGGSDPDEPVVLEEARRAIVAARAAGAKKYAPLTFGTSTQLLQLAQAQLAHGAKMKDVLDTGSEAVLIAEDARVLATARRKRGRETDPP